MLLENITFSYIKLESEKVTYKNKTSKVIIWFVIPVVFTIKIDWSVRTCLIHLYDGRHMYRIYCIKNNYMFRHFTLPIFRLRNEKMKKK